MKSALKSASSMASTVKKIAEISTAKAVNGNSKNRFALNGVTCNILQDAIKGAVL